jgi:hypothetical protein
VCRARAATTLLPAWPSPRATEVLDTSGSYAVSDVLGASSTAGPHADQEPPDQRPISVGNGRAPLPRTLF